MLRKTILVAALVLPPMCLSGTAFAWGASGHRWISELAIKALPDEIPTFLRTPDAVRNIGELGRELDRSKGTGNPHDADLDPGHYVDVSDDLTIGGGPSLKDLPPTRESYDTALRAHGFSQYKLGYLPYAIIDGWQQLVKDFAYWRADMAAQKNAGAEDLAWFVQDQRLREMLMIRDLGVWSHLVGDGSQPMHVSVHYNGWGNFPNPKSYTTEKIHAYFEGEFVRRYLTEDDVGKGMSSYVDCHCSIGTQTANYIAVSVGQVEPLYELERQHGFDGQHDNGKAFVVERLAAGASELRDMIVDAWHASAALKIGYPPVSIDDIEAGKVNPRGNFGGFD